MGTPVSVGNYPAGTAITPFSNQPPEAACRDVTVPADADCEASASIDNGSFDPDGDPITLVQDPAGPYALGDTLVTLTVTEDSGASDSCIATVTVTDDTPPAATAALVSVADPGAGDNDSDSDRDSKNLYQVVVTCTDNCDDDPEITATLSGGGSNEEDSMEDFLDIFAYILLILSILWMHFRVTHFQVIIKKESRTNLSRIFLLDGIALLMVLIGFFSPQTYIALMEEDFIGEWVTFYAFALSGLIIVAHLWSFRKNGLGLFSLSFLIPLAVVAFCLVVAGEEISWGQRIFAFKPPDLFLEQNYQQELNIHNLFKGDGFWGIQIESKHLVMLIAFFYGILFPLLTRFIPPLKNLNWHAPAFYLMPYFVLVIAMEQIYPISLTGEGCELFLGLIFLVHVFDAYPINKSVAYKGNKLYKLSTLTAFVFALGIITAPLLNLIIYGSDAEAVASVKEELQLLQKDFLNPRTNKKKILKRSRVHKRIYTAILHNYFRLSKDSLFLEGEQTPADSNSGEVRNDRKGYFLDPWNNPYWVYYYRKKNLVAFYSFGSNRKRDSNLRRDLNVQGDDLGIVFRVK